MEFIEYFIDKLPSGVAVFDRTLNIITANKGLITRQSKVIETARGKHISEIRPEIKKLTPLFSTKNNETGLGLYITKQLIEAQNGSVSFKSEEGKGTTFMVYLNAA